MTSRRYINLVLKVTLITNLCFHSVLACFEWNEMKSDGMRWNLKKGNEMWWNEMMEWNEMKSEVIFSAASRKRFFVSAKL